MSPPKCYNDGRSAVIEAITSISKNMSSVVSLSAYMNANTSSNMNANANTPAMLSVPTVFWEEQGWLDYFLNIGGRWEGLLQFIFEF
jgi:hypothetical protein